MTYRRQEMERNLPEASKFLCDFLWKNLAEAGIQIPPNDILFIGKLVSAYVKSTPHGKQTVLKMLNAEVKPASALQTYYKAGFRGDDSQKIKPRDLMTFMGWIYKGTNGVGWSSIDIDEREDTQMCDNCGGRYPEDYCTKEVEVLKASGMTRHETWCNHCRYQTDKPQIRQTGDAKVCGACEKIVCEFHPKHHTTYAPPKSNVALLPQRAVGESVPPQISMPPGWERP